METTTQVARPVPPSTFGPASLVDPRALKPSRLTNVGRIVLVAAVVASAILTLAYPLNHDAAYLLYLARTLNAGAVLYRDSLDLNPPLIVWLGQPVVALADALNIRVGIIYRGAVLLVLGASLLATVALLRRAGRTDWLIPVVIAGIYVAAVGYDFGQREHLLAAGLLPWLALGALRAVGGSVRPSTAALIGLVAAIGLALKPPVAVVVVPLVVIAQRRDTGHWLTPDLLAIVGLGLAYVGAVLVLTPDYFSLVHLYGRAYRLFAWHDIPSIVIAIPTFAVALAIVARLRRPTPMADPFLLAGIGTLLGVMIQHKAFTYHYYPMAVCALLALLLAGQRWVAITILVVGLADAKLIGASPSRHPPVSALAVALETRPEAQSVLVMSSRMEDAFPLALEGRRVWASAYPMLWVPHIYYWSSTESTPYHTRAEMDPAERAHYEQTIRDLAARPDLVLIERPETFGTLTRWGHGFNFLRYFGPDSTFRAAMADYVILGTAGGIDIYSRRDALALRDRRPR